MFTKHIARSLAVAACFFALSACDDKSAEKPQEPQVSAEQADILKYNEYVEAANMGSTSYGEELAKYLKYNKPELDGNKPPKELYFSSPTSMGRIQQQLDKARAMKPAMAELDEPARLYSEALAKAEPINRDLYNYVSAKTYKSDNGDHAREVQPAYLASMQDLVVAQAKFLNGVDAKDRARIKAEFEKTKKDSIEYYRMGAIFYLKESMDAAGGFIDGEGLGDKKEAFKTALNQFNSMLTSYDAKMREHNKVGCSNLLFTANEYLAKGRDVIERTENGRYEEDKKQPKQFQLMQSTEQTDGSSLLQDYNNMISAINTDRC